MHKIEDYYMFFVEKMTRFQNELNLIAACFKEYRYLESTPLSEYVYKVLIPHEIKIMWLGKIKALLKDE